MNNNAVRHFLTLSDFTPVELLAVIGRAIELKALQKRGEIFEPLKNRTLAMIFEKSSTRTRVSFEAGMTQLGGHSMFLSPNDTQLGRGEPIEDSARVISRMVDVVMIRTFEQEKVETFAAHSRVPVINALTDKFHPCQLLADMMTWMEQRGLPNGKTVAWVGDGNNMCHSWMEAAQLFGFHLNVACPEGYDPDADMVKATAGSVTYFRDPNAAVKGAEVVVTDTWASMGQEAEKKIREKAFAGYQVDTNMMQLAAKDAIFMHCLPAYRGLEVSAEVMDGSQSVVWDEAENRLHAQKALLEVLVCGFPAGMPE
ncbi:MAG TPA: ornithine carbamoyltransferase [Candidatus Thiothrix moscowensis]|uniref:ornithine carbamoyltransferase n=1 Tax=unclassified Thiothrix TaxID=2636184 RepID=UPI001A274ECA|nr:MULTISPECIES: ornithine carbamoyltransferase [unclassified Thiothrix]MBJ6612125.1 ornithine carbamoyltransferase [Candidatus Thiothrix moscowensis]HRJ51382.1 ornithine carbamoyltransferase [Candidatus Thiothrix moscowensis]HRJ91563.1 ornithine carbamoyltransferase [Candidatus Thiothrix moscowensis]